MTLYAKVENGLLKGVTNIIGDLSEDRRKAEGLYFYDRQLNAVYDPSTHKEDGTETVIEGEVVVVRPKVVAKTLHEIYEDKVEARRLSIPSSTERIEVLVSVIDKLIKWVDLQANPDNPASISDITNEERTFIHDLVGALGSPLLPQRPKV